MKKDKIIKIQQGDVIIKTTVHPKKEWGKNLIILFFSSLMFQGIPTKL